MRQLKDHLRGVIVLLVLLTGSLCSAGTARGESWENVTTTTHPVATEHHALTYDVDRSVTICYGTEYGNSDAIWEWNGTSWSEYTPTPRPPARVHPLLAYDTVRDVTVMWGGVASSNWLPLTDTWEWNGTSWTQRSPGANPPGAWGTAGPASRGMVFDESKGVTVLLGSFDSGGGNFRTQTWEFDGTNWSLKSDSPEDGRYTRALEYVPNLGVTVFGGHTYAGECCIPCHQTSNDIWVWSLTTGGVWAWLPAELTHDSCARVAEDDQYVVIRSNHSTAFDRTRGQLVTLGGFDPGGNKLRSTWGRSLSGWSLIKSSADSPPKRQSHKMVYDRTRGRIVLVGGIGPDFSGSQTWELPSQ